MLPDNRPRPRAAFRQSNEPLSLSVVPTPREYRQPDRNMMNSGASLLQKLSDRRFRAQRFQQFDVRLANWQHRDAHSLFGNLFGGINLQAQSVLPKRQWPLQVGAWRCRCGRSS